ncbi:response regulator [Methanobacterium sp. ACI-7]|uniref:response regulator n=1 Tax=Methanobacterium sp. ACI-7 TaxID=3240853 RepID=UPI0039C28285
MNNVTNILLVEDNPADARLIEEVLKDTNANNKLHVVKDGVDAMNFLYKKEEFSDAPRPDIILLDLNLPRKDGREVLKEVKENEELKSIPIVILTTSSANEDIIKTYNNHANYYITKPVDFDQFLKVINAIEDFWLNIVRLP